MNSEQNPGLATDEKKYWIQPGIFVTHDSLPGIKITVDSIEREPRDRSNRRKLIGVKCHWIYNGVQQEGLFRTDELKEYGI